MAQSREIEATKLTFFPDTPYELSLRIEKESLDGDEIFNLALALVGEEKHCYKGIIPYNDPHSSSLEADKIVRFQYGYMLLQGLEYSGYEHALPKGYLDDFNKKNERIESLFSYYEKFFHYVKHTFEIGNQIAIIVLFELAGNHEAAEASSQKLTEMVVSQAKIEAAKIADSGAKELCTEINRVFPNGAPAEFRQLIDQYRDCIWRKELAVRQVSPFFKDAEKIQKEYAQFQSRIFDPVTAIIDLLVRQINEKKIKITDAMQEQVKIVALTRHFLGPNSEQAVTANLVLQQLISKPFEESARALAAKSKQELEAALAILNDLKQETEEKKEEVPYYKVQILPEHLSAIKLLIEKYEQCVYQHVLEKQQGNLKQATVDEYKNANARIYNPILALKSLSESIDRKLQSLSFTLDPAFEKSLRENHLTCCRDCELAKMGILPDLQHAQEKYKQSLKNLDDVLLSIRKIKAPWLLYIQNQLDQIACLGVVKTPTLNTAMNNLLQAGVEWSLAKHGIYPDAQIKHEQYKIAESQFKAVRDDLAKAAMHQQSVWLTALKPSRLANRLKNVSPLMELLQKTSCRR